jgi:pyruvate/2-oxoglutarate dehydrogenase complex dihydrolipoamide acyltransferase (E2) component
MLNSGRKMNAVHFCFEADITAAKKKLGELKQTQTNTPSITSFVLHCFVRAVEENPVMNAYRKGSKRLIVFEDIDVTVVMEKTPKDGSPLPTTHIVRSANRKSLSQIQQEIGKAKNQTFEEQFGTRWLNVIRYSPGVFRKLMFWRMRNNPLFMKEHAGTVGLTSPGMFGKGVTYGIPISMLNTTLFVGTIAQRPMLINDQLENRDFICLTLTCNHDVVDGAPMTRFISRLRTLIEESYELATCDRLV